MRAAARPDRAHQHPRTTIAMPASRVRSSGSPNAAAANSTAEAGATAVNNAASVPLVRAEPAYQHR